MSNSNGRIGQERNSEPNGDMVCRTVVAALAAMIALRLCQAIKRAILGE